MIPLLLSLVARPQAVPHDLYRWKNVLTVGRSLPESAAVCLVSPREGPHLVFGSTAGLMGPQGDKAFRALAEGTESLDAAVFAPLLAARCGKEGSYSLDGGMTWNVFAQAPPNAGGGSIVLNSTAETIVWNTGGSTWQTFNRGVTWSPCQGLSGSLQLVADRVTPTRLWAVRGPEIWMSDNTGRSFQRLDISLPEPHGLMRASGDGIGDLWLPASDGLYRSMDSGKSFSRLPGVGAVESIGFGKSAPGQRYPAVFVSGHIGGVTGVFRSDDAGRHWLLITDTHHEYGPHCLVVGDPRIYGRVYVSAPTAGILYADRR